MWPWATESRNKIYGILSLFFVVWPSTFISIDDPTFGRQDHRRFRTGTKEIEIRSGKKGGTFKTGNASCHAQFGYCAAAG